MFRLIKRQKGEKIVWTLKWRDIIKDNCYMPITHIKGFKWWPHKKYVRESSLLTIRLPVFYGS